MNSAIFAVVDAVLLTPLAFDDPDRLVYVAAEMPEFEVGRDLPLSGGDVQDVAARVPSLSAVSGFTQIRQNFVATGLTPFNQIQASSNLKAKR